MTDCLFAGPPMKHCSSEMEISQILTWDLIYCRLDIITIQINEVTELGFITLSFIRRAHWNVKTKWIES